VAGISCDGDRFYFLSYSENRLYSRNAGKNSLKRIVSIDVAVEDLLALLAGGIPVQKDGRARLEEDEGLGTMLVVEDGDRRYVETVVLDPSRTRVRQFERRKRSGKLLFRVDVTSVSETDGFLLPVSMTLVDDDGAEIQMTVERSWVNPELAGDQFVLNAP
jgi:hypothetical protein